jgi:hypothetical protein
MTQTPHLTPRHCSISTPLYKTSIPARLNAPKTAMTKTPLESTELVAPFCVHEPVALAVLSAPAVMATSKWCTSVPEIVVCMAIDVDCPSPVAISAPLQAADVVPARTHDSVAVPANASPSTSIFVVTAAM